jgi:hypothetical protein
VTLGRESNLYIVDRLLRRAGLIVLLTALAAVSASSAPARTGPALTIRSVAPLLVVGHGFAARERVRITVWRASRRVDDRRVRAGAGGSFRLRFPILLATDTCSGSLVVLARGAAGSRASARHVCHPPDPAGGAHG